MPTRHTISTRDKWFIDRHLKDPLTHSPFKVGDTVVICANCKSVHYDSTWGFNPNKPCSVCESKEQLNYRVFSPAIFQATTRGNSKFVVIKNKLPFRTKLEMFNGYPIAISVAVILPLLLIAYTFIFSLNFDAVVAKIKRISETKLTEIEVGYKQNNDDLHQNLNHKFNNIDSNFGNAMLSFADAETAIVESPINSNLGHIQSNLNDATESAVSKFERMFNKIDEFLYALFG